MTEGVKQSTSMPTHVAIIMDGNGRWAKAHGLPRIAGHQAGTENLRRIIKACVEFGVKYLTVYAFSTENWGRPRDEVEGLIGILENVIDKELGELDEQGVRLIHIGRLEHLSPGLQSKVRSAMEMTKTNTRLTVVIAFNYGGRDELVYALQSMIKDGIRPEDVTEEQITNHLFTHDIPDPDLIIRTSGEMRLSNFLLWQSAYSEYYVTPTFWPDFNKVEFRKALDEFCKRNRRFGCLEENSDER